MVRHSRVYILGLAVLVSLSPTMAFAQTDKSGTDEANAGAKEPAAPLKGPKYLNLRFDEDFSYLAGEPGSYEEDFWDPIKNIQLDDDWTLSLGGEFRVRVESESNKAFGTAARTNDTFQLYRFFMHADLKYNEKFRLFVQGAMVFDEDRDRALRGIDENKWDLQQLFFDLNIGHDDCPLTLRVGRQELQYGKQRLVSPLDWANTRRRFDGVKLFAHGDTWDIDFWYVKPVPVQRKQRDRYNEDVDFWGAYATYKAIPRHGWDFYFMAIDDTGNALNPNGNAGDRSLYTLGSRFWGKTGGFDYETELAGQWGRWAGDTIQAWSVTIDGGYTFADVPWKPRLGAGFDWASGDEDPTDGKVGTFNQLFPLGHAYFGFLDLIGRQNIKAVNVNLAAWPIPKKVKVRLAYHAFWLDANEDALYNAGGAPTRRDPFGRSGREVGHEVDLTMLWKVDRHSSVLVGYSHFWDSDFIIQTGASEDPEMFYIHYQYKF